MDQTKAAGNLNTEGGNRIFIDVSEGHFFCSRVTSCGIHVREKRQILLRLSWQRWRGVQACLVGCGVVASHPIRIGMLDCWCVVSISALAERTAPTATCTPPPKTPRASFGWTVFLCNIYFKEIEGMVPEGSWMNGCTHVLGRW